MELDEAKLVLEKEKKERAELCLAEIDAVLKKHQCELDFGLLLKPGKNPSPQFQIIALG